MKFIKLTRAEQPLILNVQKITAIYSNTLHTRILIGDDYWDVDEDLDTVLHRIKMVALEQ